MNEIMTGVNQWVNGEVGQGIQQMNDLTGQSTAAIIVLGVVGLVLCFFGLKLIRVLAAICGLTIGVILGIPLAILLGLEGLVFGIVMLACGIVLAIISVALYRVGVFFWAFLAGSGIAVVLISPDNMVTGIICLAIGLIIAILVEIWLEPLVIIISGLNGGVSAGAAIAVLAGFNGNAVVMYGAAIVLAILGMLTQFMMRSRELGKAETQYSKNVKASASREAEVEKARMVLDEDGDTSGLDPDEDDDIKFID